MQLKARIEAFAELGKELNDKGSRTPFLQKAVIESGEINPWFTPGFIDFAIREISRLLDKERLEKWISGYPEIGREPLIPKHVGVILAGNIPLVGFHDFLCVILSGSKFTGKLSGKDDKLLPALAGRLPAYLPQLEDLMEFTEGTLGSVDAIIATGSDNTSRYFQYYFGKYPHIFRKNRHGIALLSGNESDRDLAGLADDIFLYFGLGCRSVSKLYLPYGFDFERFFSAMEKYRHLEDHHKYANNHQYYRTVYLMNRIEHIDNGFLILKQDQGLGSPVSVVYYDFYSSLEALEEEINTETEKVQCLVSGIETDLPVIPFGKSQLPEPWDYADNMDTMNFLLNLYQN